MATGDCSLCHTVNDWVSSALPTGHMPNPSNVACSTCHASAPNDYTPATLAANSKLHTGITGNCGLCHGDNVTAAARAAGITRVGIVAERLELRPPYPSRPLRSLNEEQIAKRLGTFG